MKRIPFSDCHLSDCAVDPMKTVSNVVIKASLAMSSLISFMIHWIHSCPIDTVVYPPVLEPFTLQIILRGCHRAKF